MKCSQKEPVHACPECGEMNRIAAPFCHACGARMYSGDRSPEPAKSGKQSRAVSALRSALRSLIFLSIVAIFGLAFWPYSAQRIPQGSDPGRQMERYLEIAATALDEESPIPASRVTQQNLNAYLGQAMDTETNKLLGAVLDAPSVILLANEPLGPFNLTTRLVLQPREDTGAFHVADLWVGHLPLPRFMAGPWTRGLAGRFDLDADRRLWNHLKLTEVNSTHIYLELEL